MENHFFRARNVLGGEVTSGEENRTARFLCPKQSQLRPRPRAMEVARGPWRVERSDSPCYFPVRGASPRVTAFGKPAWSFGNRKPGLLEVPLLPWDSGRLLCWLVWRLPACRFVHLSEREMQSLAQLTSAPTLLWPRLCPWVSGWGKKNLWYFKLYDGLCLSESLQFCIAFGRTGVSKVERWVGSGREEVQEFAVWN